MNPNIKRQKLARNSGFVDKVPLDIVKHHILPYVSLPDLYSVCLTSKNNYFAVLEYFIHVVMNNDFN
ncbi:MAG: hypothetical protein ACTSUE_07950, partial [Promethearchaeota archaeon]